MIKSKKYAVGATLAAAMLTATACSGSSEGNGDTVTLTVASWATPGSVSELMGDWWYNEIETRTDGRVTFEISAADSLCTSTEIPECVRDGRVDIGQTLTDYSSQLFPQTNIASIPFLSPGSAPVSRAIYELSTEHEGSAKLWEKNNLHPISHVPPGRLLIGANRDLSTVDSLKGLRLRTAGKYAQEAVDAIAVNSVAIPAPETYEGLERGVVDAVAFPLDGTVAYQLKDAASDWTDPGIGTYTTIGMWMNKQTYDGLPEDIRTVIDEVTEEFNSGKSNEIWRDATLEQCDILLDTIGDLKQWDESETKKWADAIGDGVEEKWVADAEKDGLEGAQEYLDAYKQKLEEYGDVEEDPSLTCAKR